MSEFEMVNAERIEIERLLRANTLALSKCAEPAAMAVSGAGSLRIQRARPSASRAALLAEERKLVARRNHIYARWSELRGGTHDAR